MGQNFLTGLKRPEYTGDNRCVPCTVTNVVLAILLGSGLYVGGSQLASPVVGAAAGLGVFAVSLAGIYLRGYLVPGTPTLTKRYFPEWALRLFGKRPDRTRDRTLEDGFDPEATLVEAGILAASADGDGQRLSGSFHESWTSALDEVTGAERATLGDSLPVDDEIELDDFGRALRVYVDDRIVGKWGTEAAFRADLASQRVLATRYDGWEDLSAQTRAGVLERLRLSLHVCPACGGDVDRGTETVSGCCNEFETTTTTCTECDTRLYIETCPDCDSATEYVTEPVELDDVTFEAGTVSCLDCGIRVSMVPSPSVRSE